MQRFTDAAGVTVGAKNLNEILWLLTASDAVFDKWGEIRDLWLTGDLPGKDGECDGRKRSDNSITVAMFKGFKGITDEAVIISLFEKVLNKECVLVQDKTFRKLPLLSTLTRSYKVQRELKKVILKHVNEKWAEELGAETNWKDLAAEIPELDSEQELRKMESALTFEYNLEPHLEEQDCWRSSSCYYICGGFLLGSEVQEEPAHAQGALSHHPHP